MQVLVSNEITMWKRK